MYFYGARWYDGTLGRFIQADTIIPNGYNSQAFDRYAYVLNNPMRFIDPTGHKDLDSGKGYYDGVPWEDRLLDKFLRDWGITITGKLSNQAKKNILEAARLAGLKDSKEIGGSPMSAFVEAHGPVNIEVTYTPITNEGNCETVGNTITCHQPPIVATTIHEFGHIFDNYYEDMVGRPASDYIPDIFMGNTNGYICGSTKCMSHPYNSKGGVYNRPEEFANMYENWVLDGLTVNQVPFGFDDTDMGGTRDNWMNSSNGFPGAGMGFFFKEMRLR